MILPSKGGTYEEESNSCVVCGLLLLVLIGSGMMQNAGTYTTWI